MRLSLSNHQPLHGRGSSPADASAYLPVTVPMMARFAGMVTRRRVSVLTRVDAQPYPQAVPPGPLPREAQGSWAHGPTNGGAYFVQLPPPPLFFLRQRNEIPVPTVPIAGPGAATSMNTARPGRGFTNWKKGPGGRFVTASPLVVPTWPVIGSRSTSGGTVSGGS